MSRKTKTHRSTQFDRDSKRQAWSVKDAPRVEGPLALVCGACGTQGEYHVGTVMIDTRVANLPDRDAIERAAGFSGYFRCRKCDAGGPWKLPEETAEFIFINATASLMGMEDVPLIFGCLGTFDRHIFRYTTESEAHLKELIDREPERAFLWVRLGNLYSHAGENGRAEEAFLRAIELDPKDIEAHSMFGQVLNKTGRSLEAVPNWHAVLNHAREARQVKKELRRELVRGAIECLLAAHAESHGQIDLLPTLSREEFAERRGDEPVILGIREFDLGSEEGLEDLCDTFLQAPRRNSLGLFRGRGKRIPDRMADWPAAPIHRQVPVVGRNAPCPCGSGHKYKKCCGR